MATTTMSKKAQKMEERENAIAYLREILKNEERPRLYTILRKVSSSGMSRQISVKFAKDGEVFDLTYSVAKALEWPLVEGFNRAIKVHGAGMDMGFHLVYTLSAVLYGYEERGAYRIRQEWM
jgi:hypothetical protein